MDVSRAERLNADEWQTVSALFLDAIERTGDAREQVLSDLTGDRAWLRAEVESLLLAHESAGDFIDLHRVPDLVGARIGPWRLVAEIARGGMGVVYRAERDDDQFEKQAAIKVVNPDLRTSELLLRFRTERRVLARLEHPNIARLLDSGVSEDGLPYIVMELVDGLPLRSYLASRPVGIDERLRLFQDVCAAVHVAHQHLVVHRDLKPANVLVTGSGDVKLVDFGIAKLLSETMPAGDMTTAIRRFTPEYASPEQLSDEPISTASDVYSLGVLLYELVAGRPPFDVDGLPVAEAARLICAGGPPPLTSIGVDRRASKDLDAIVAQAMHRDPRERYGSARELADDVRRHQEGRPVQARARSIAYVARKFVVRHRFGSAAVALLLLSIVAGVIGIVWQGRIAERQRAIAERRFDDIRQLAGSVLFELHDSIATLPGS